MRPAALRGALDDFDSNLAAAKALAASSGNGATLVFAPQTGGAPGFTLRVYSGRPTASGAVTTTNTMAAISATSVSEAHFGNPPFAIFLNSAGYPTGTANYPSLDAQENPTFNVDRAATAVPERWHRADVYESSRRNGDAHVAVQHRRCVCSRRGSDADTKSTACFADVSARALHHRQWTAEIQGSGIRLLSLVRVDANGAPCQTQSSDTGAAPATFASPWPYAQPSPSSQGGAAPAPPEFAPYTWPVGDPNDPPALFQLSPVLHNGGMCTVTVADDYNQTGGVTVQVMGDLTPSTTSLTLTVGKGGGAVNFSKTFDSEQLLLSAGGHCLGIVTAQPQIGSTFRMGHHRTRRRPRALR